MEAEKTLIEKAEEAAKRLETANQKAEQILSNKIMAGRSTVEAETPKVEKTEAEKRREATKEFFKGTAIEGAVQRYG